MHINHVLMAFLIILTRPTKVPIAVAEHGVGAHEVVGALIGVPVRLTITLKEIQGEQRLEITSRI